MNRHTHIAIWTFAPLLLSMCCAGCPINPNPAGTGGAPAGGSISTGGSPATGGVGPVAGAAGAPQQTKCQLACTNLARLGCPEDQSTCVGQCAILTRDARFTFDADCRINATTKAAAQACGIASCK